MFESGVVSNGKSIKWNSIDSVKINVDNFGIFTVEINYGKDEIILFLLNKHGKRFENILRSLNIKQI
jgi:branched-subunit amino acid aminotransferase/4-amino-4-deoxychorismate lyase